MGDGLAVVGKHGFLQIDDNYLQLKIVGEGTVYGPKYDGARNGYGSIMYNAGTGNRIYWPTNYNTFDEYTIVSASTNMGNRGTVTLNTSNHGLAAGDTIIIQGVPGRNGISLNGIQTVIAVDNDDDNRIDVSGWTQPPSFGGFFNPNISDGVLKVPSTTSAPYNNEDVLIFARLAGDKGIPGGSLGIEIEDGYFYFIAPSGDTNWYRNSDLYIEYIICATAPLTGDEVTNSGGLEVLTKDGDVSFTSERECFLGEDFVSWSSDVTFNSDTQQPVGTSHEFREETRYYFQTQHPEGIKDYYVLMNGLGGAIAIHINGSQTFSYRYKEWRNFMNFQIEDEEQSYVAINKMPYREYGNRTDNGRSFSFRFGTANRSIMIGKFR